MDEMRALLDSLMGSDRNNLSAAGKPSRASFKDPGVCHSYLVDFCPHDLFPNTKSDLGPCPNKHSDSFREQYLIDPEHEYYRRKYEKEFLNTLHQLVEGVEQRIKKGQERILGPDEGQLEQERQKKLEQMKDEISSLLSKAQEAGEKGNIAEAEAYTRKVTEIRCDLDRMSSLSHNYLAISSQEKSLRVCPVCGAMQSLGDATSRFESHVSGKQHVGYERIRATYEKLKAKYRPDSASKSVVHDTTDPTSTTTQEPSVPTTASVPGATDDSSLHRQSSFNGQSTTHRNRSPINEGDDYSSSLRGGRRWDNPSARRNLVNHSRSRSGSHNRRRRYYYDDDRRDHHRRHHHYSPRDSPYYHRSNRRYNSGRSPAPKHHYHYRKRHNESEEEGDNNSASQKRHRNNDSHHPTSLERSGMKRSRREHHSSPGSNDENDNDDAAIKKPLRNRSNSSSRRKISL